jgi:putative nucleotidyltransferase with HDIG domain
MYTEGHLTVKKRKYIHIYQCKQGDVLADDVYDDYGILIISKNAKVDENVIKKLESFQVRQLLVYDRSETERPEKPAKGSSIKEFKKDYRKNLNTIKQVLNDLASGKKLCYEKVEQISSSIYSKIANISSIIECINEVRHMDEYTYTHSINVSVYALLIARWLDMPEKEVRDIVTAGILHDIGKSRIPSSILNKKGTLLPEEFEQMKTHTVIGYKISKDIPQLTYKIREGILMHHEREDGNGYPKGIKGNNISMYAKIISVADVYDALTSERVYKKRITPFDTFRELERIGYGHFDTKVMMTFLSNISSYYIGSTVKMNTGEIGKVIFTPIQSISTPVVFINGRYVDLSKNKELKIVEML